MLAVAVLTLGLAAADDPIVAQIRSKLSDPAKPFVLTFAVTLKAGHEQPFLALAAKTAAATRKEAGCLAYEFSTSTDAPAEVLLYERWANLDSLAAHMKSPHTQALLAKLPEALDGTPKLTVRKLVGD